MLSAHGGEGGNGVSVHSRAEPLYPEVEEYLVEWSPPDHPVYLRYDYGKAHKTKCKPQSWKDTRRASPSLRVSHFLITLCKEVTLVTQYHKGDSRRALTPARLYGGELYEALISYTRSITTKRITYISRSTGRYER